MRLVATQLLTMRTVQQEHMIGGIDVPYLAGLNHVLQRSRESSTLFDLGHVARLPGHVEVGHQWTTAEALIAAVGLSINLEADPVQVAGCWLEGGDVMLDQDDYDYRVAVNLSVTMTGPLGISDPGDITPAEDRIARAIDQLGRLRRFLFAAVLLGGFTVIEGDG